MSAPVVSVLMITYNHEAHIAKAIEGVLMQSTCFPFELIIGEDCSTDTTRTIAMQYAEHRPEVIDLVTSADNVGMKRNAKRILDRAKGKYVAWCEGDDWWLDDSKLQKQVDLMEAENSTGLVYSDHDRVDTITGAVQHRYIRSLGYPPTGNPGIEEILAGTAGIQTCTVMARTQMVRSIIEGDPYLYGSDEILMGDAQLWAEICLQSEIRYIDESLAARAILPESATQSKSQANRLRFWISSSLMRLYLCDKYSLSIEIRKPHERLWRRRSLKLALIENDESLADRVKIVAPDFDTKDYILYWAAKCQPLGALFRALPRGTD